MLMSRYRWLLFVCLSMPTLGQVVTVTETEDGVEVEMLVSELVTETEVVGPVPTEIVRATTLTTTEFVSLATDDADERFRDSIRNGANSARCSATSWDEKETGYFESCSAPEEEGGTGYIYIGHTTTTSTSADVTLTQTETISTTISTLEPEESHTPEVPGSEESEEHEEEEEEEEEGEGESDDGLSESDSEVTELSEDPDPSEEQAAVAGGILTLTSTFMEDPPHATGEVDSPTEDDGSQRTCRPSTVFWLTAVYVCVVTSLTYLV